MLADGNKIGQPDLAGEITVHGKMAAVLCKLVSWLVEARQTQVTITDTVWQGSQADILQG
jgi:hypothetical protein